MIEAQLILAYQGPNPYGAEPGIVASLDLKGADLRAVASRCAQIAAACSAWQDYAAASGPGEPASPGTARDIAGFIVRLSRAALNEVRGDIQSAEVFEEDGRLLVYLGYHHQEVSFLALKSVIGLVNAAKAVTREGVEAHFAPLWKLCPRFHPDYQARIVMQGARSKGIPFLPFVPHSKYWQYGWGCNGRVFFESASMEDARLGAQLADSKPAAKAVFAALGLPVAPHCMVKDEGELEAAAATVGWPLVVKPSNLGRSLGVTVNVRSMPDLVAAFRAAREYGPAPVMVERCIPGDVYRIMVARGKVACIIRRAPPYVEGDGRQTLQQLVITRNRSLAAARRPGGYIGETPLDADFHDELQRQNVRLEDIIPMGKTVRLRKVPLLSTGAVYSDVTDKAHPDITRMAETLADALGFAVCGIDYMSDNIAESYAQQGAVIELNGTPGLRVPLVAGMSAEAVGQMVLGDAPARIPVALVVCDKPSLAAVRDALPVGEEWGWVVNGECGVGSLRLQSLAVRGSGHDLRVYDQANQVLRNPRASRIVIACDADTLAAHGLPVDRCDMAITYGVEPGAPLTRVLKQYSAEYRELADIRHLPGALAW